MSTMPAGILTQRQPLPNGMIYAFSHEQLGKLGKLILSGEGRGTGISAQVERGDMSDPKYLQRLETLSQVIQCILDALPGDYPAVSSLDELQRRVAVYQRFLHVQNAAEMEHFARSLTAQEQELLFEVIAGTSSTTMQTRDLDETYGMVQREHDLRRLLGEDDRNT